MLLNVTKFITFLNQFRAVERRILATGTDRHENAMEHSYQLALLSWHINDSENLGLDLQKILTYSLVHDLVEAYTGDTLFMSASEATREEREDNALARIETEFNDIFPALAQYIHDYEAQNDPEARFVLALDKIIPILNSYMDDGRTWREHYPGLNIPGAVEIKRSKADNHPKIRELLEEVLEIILANKKKYFDQD